MTAESQQQQEGGSQVAQTAGRSVLDTNLIGILEEDSEDFDEEEDEEEYDDDNLLRG